MFDTELTGGKIFLSDKHLTLFLQAFKPDSLAVAGVEVGWVGDRSWALRHEARNPSVSIEAEKEGVRMNTTEEGVNHKDAVIPLAALIRVQFICSIQSHVFILCVL